MAEIENRMVVDSEWEAMEQEEEKEPGYFSQWGTFVKEEYLLEVAQESVQKDSFIRDSFLEKVLDYIENDKEATKKFLKWFYKDYEKE